MISYRTSSPCRVFTYSSMLCLGQEVNSELAFLLCPTLSHLLAGLVHCGFAAHEPRCKKEIIKQSCHSAKGSCLHPPPPPPPPPLPSSSSCRKTQHNHFSPDPVPHIAQRSARGGEKTPWQTPCSRAPTLHPKAFGSLHSRYFKKSQECNKVG